MKGYFATICAVPIAVIGIAIGIGSVPLRNRPLGDSTIHGIVGYGGGSVMVAVLWLICFRPQRQKRGVSLVSLFVLIAMESAFFSAFQFFNPTL